jgi:hypothetical protein
VFASAYAASRLDIDRFDMAGDVQLLRRDVLCHLDRDEVVAKNFIDLLETLSQCLWYEEEHQSGADNIHHDEEDVVAPSNICKSSWRRLRKYHLYHDWELSLGHGDSEFMART